MSKSRAQQKGFTLIEIMIALVLGAFLIGGVIQLFVSTRQTFLMEDALSRLQENGRFAMEFIGREIRLADYRFCPSKPRMADAVAGTDGNSATNPDAPDSITVRWSSRTCADPLNTSNVTNQLSINTANGIKILLRNANIASNQLVEGVENMQVLYGVDTDGNRIPNYYAPATGLNMAQVVSIRVSLLLSTIEDNIAASPLSYVFNNETVPVPVPSDRRLRRVFTTTFALRNRIP